MKKIIFISICILLNCACSKSNNPAPDNPYGLPNATQTGANVFACRVNGRNFIEYYNLGKTDALLLSDTIRIFTNKTVSSNVYQHLIIDIKNPIVNYTYTTNDTVIKFRYISDSSCLGYSSPTSYLFASNIYTKITKFDKQYKIVSGTFTSKIPIPNCDTLIITDGRFDFNYY